MRCLNFYFVISVQSSSVVLIYLKLLHGCSNRNGSTEKNLKYHICHVQQFPPVDSVKIHKEYQCESRTVILVSFQVSLQLL